MSKDSTTPEPDQPLNTESATTAAGTSTTAAPAQEPTPATNAASKSPAPKSKAQVKAEKKAADPLRGSRASGFYASVVALGILLILLIIFIFQNTQKTTVNYLGWSGQVSVAVALLIAAAAGLFVAVLASSLRILQLRRRIKRDRKAA